MLNIYMHISIEVYTYIYAIDSHIHLLYIYICYIILFVRVQCFIIYFCDIDSVLMQMFKDDKI